MSKRKRRDISPMEIVIEILRTADLRIRVGHPTAEQARKDAVEELKLARALLNVLIDDYIL